MQFTFEKNNLLCKKKEKHNLSQGKIPPAPPDIKWSVPYQVIHGLAPSYLCEMLPLYISGRKLRSAESLLLCPPKCRTVTYGSKSFLGISCTLWNSLPKNLRETRSLSCFKPSLKTHLFKEAFLS